MGPEVEGGEGEEVVVVEAMAAVVVAFGEVVVVVAVEEEGDGDHFPSEFRCVFYDSITQKGPAYCSIHKTDIGTVGLCTTAW